jgi:hypothetical protein
MVSTEPKELFAAEATSSPHEPRDKISTLNHCPGSTVNSGETAVNKKVARSYLDAAKRDLNRAADLGGFR